MPISRLVVPDVTLPLLPNRRKSVRDFQKGINQGIDGINRLIDAYGYCENFKQKTRSLDQIIRLIQALSILKPDPTIDSHFKILGTFWNQALFEIKVEQRRQNALASPLTLSDFISSLSPEEAEVLAKILTENEGKSLLSSLQTFYPLGHSRKEALDVFLESHTIEILSSGNSKNFKVSNLETEKSQLLKLEYWGRYGNQVDTHLRSQLSLSSVFSSIYSEQAVSYFHPFLEKQVSGRVTVTEFFIGSDLATYSKRFEDNDEALLEVAAFLYTQMADILIKIKAAGCAFTDMKNTNWLVDAEGILRISDGKSFVPHNRSGDITPDIICFKTDDMCAPEQLIAPRPNSISTDKVHVYLLAKNLYCFLTRNRGALLYERGRLKQDASEFDFTHPVFDTLLGSEYRSLIEMTMKKEPDDRLLTVAQFKAHMDSIRTKYIQGNSIEVPAVTRNYIKQDQLKKNSPQLRFVDQEEYDASKPTSRYNGEA